jgi:heme/copper-type cytochrome/quinol oxidase subunit 3
MMRDKNTPMAVRIIAIYLCSRAAVFVGLFIAKLVSAPQQGGGPKLGDLDEMAILIATAMILVAIGLGLWLLADLSRKALTALFAINALLGRSAVGLMFGISGIHARLSTNSRIPFPP